MFICWNADKMHEKELCNCDLHCSYCVSYEWFSMCEWLRYKHEKYRWAAIPGKQGTGMLLCNYLSKINCIWTLKTIHEVLSVCLLARKIGLACSKFYRNFSFKRSYISCLACLVCRMNKKQKLTYNCFYTFNSTLDQLNVNLNSQHFDLTTFRRPSRSVNASEGKFERFN